MAEELYTLRKTKYLTCFLFFFKKIIYLIITVFIYLIYSLILPEDTTC